MLFNVTIKYLKVEINILNIITNIFYEHILQSGDKYIK